MFVSSYCMHKFFFICVICLFLVFRVVSWFAGVESSTVNYIRQRKDKFKRTDEVLCDFNHIHSIYFLIQQNNYCFDRSMPYLLVSIDAVFASLNELRNVQEFVQEQTIRAQSVKRKLEEKQQRYCYL